MCRRYTVRIAWKDNSNANSSRTYGTVIHLKGTTASSQVDFNYTLTEKDAEQGNTAEHVFRQLPAKDKSGNLYQYHAELVGLPENYTVTEHQSDGRGAAFTLVNVRDIEVTVVWLDERNSDGKRPENMQLNLYSDSLSAGKYAFVRAFSDKTVSERGGQSVWTYRFEDLPVWSVHNTDREVNYLYYIEQDEAKVLDDDGYAVDYKGYETEANIYSRENETYFIYLSREPETADYETVITWEDDKNKSGIRPSAVKVQLYADRQDGKGSLPTGQEQKISGAGRAESWNGVWKDLRVYENEGKKIIYTLVLEDIRGYRAEYAKDVPSVILKLDSGSSGNGGSSGGSGSDDQGGSSGSGGGTGGGSGTSGGSSSGGSGNGSGGNGSEGGNTSGSGSGASGGSGQDTGDQSMSNEKDADVSALLNTREHIAYMKGYPDKTFRADGNMTRAEAAQMFFNLLNERNADGSSSSRGFHDMKNDAWYAKAAAKLSSLGIIKGYEDGSFRGNQTITRAEFTAMAVRFAKIDDTADCSYSDISKTGWQYPSVSTAAKYGWIQGYGDNTFRPNRQITRGEVATIVNRMLKRSADKAYIGKHKSELKSFGDLSDTHWAYFNIAEAVNEHGFSKSTGYEVWENI